MIEETITSRLMLVRLTRTAYSARKYDKKITAEVADAHNTKGDAGRYNKILIAKEALEAGQKAANDARTFLYAQTLPGPDEGLRILPTANFLPFTKEITRKIDAIKAADENFIDHYQEYKDAAKIRLNGIYDEMDYPDLDTVKSKFSVSISFSPVPGSRWTEVIDGLSTDIKEEIQKQSDLKVKETIDQANADLWRRLFDVVKHAAERLSDPTAIFRDSLITNISDLCELLPRLNVTADPNLETMRRQVLDKLTAHDPADLRPKETDAPTVKAAKEATRKQTAEEAAKLLKDLEAYFPTN